MAFPASRTTAALNELHTSTYEEYDPRIIDLTAKSSPILFAAQPDWLDFYKLKPLGHHTIGSVLDTLEDEATPWDGESSTPVTAARVARGTYWEPANYFKGAGITWREVMEARDPYEHLDILDQRVYVAYKRLVETLARDLWRGNAANALRITGYHQGIYPKSNVASATGSTSTSLIIDQEPKWTFRQANNTYGGVARSAFTAEDVGGTNWENLSVNLDLDFHGDSVSTFTNSSGTAGRLYTIMDYLYEMCAEGLDYPDLVVMSQRVYSDYKAGMLPYLRWQRTGTEQRGANFTIENLMYQKAVVIVDNNCRFTTAIGDASASTPDAFFFMNTGGGEYLEIAADPAANCSMSDFYSDSDTPLNSKCLVVSRIRNRVLGPHRQLVAFNYGGT